MIFYKADGYTELYGIKVSVPTFEKYFSIMKEAFKGSRFCN